MKKLLKLSNLHLSISTVIVASISIIYGFKPEFLFNITVRTIDEFNILKAIMGLYLAFSSIWIIGIYFKKYWQTATITNILFMFGLAFGRILSVLLDGFPSSLFILGTFGEIILGSFAFYQYKKQTNFK